MTTIDRTAEAADIRPISLLITCEHGGNEVPAAYAPLFTGMDAVLASHRGWDPGALELARQMAAALEVPVHAATTTRLLIDLNRSIGHRTLFSEFTRPLPRSVRQQIVDEFYRPHRDAVEHDVARRVAGGARVIHIAAHSFTPVLDGSERRADLGWLYDPRRATEVAWVRSWMASTASLEPGLRLRRNYPYQGRSDGLQTLLRKRFPDAVYAGIELEVNQRFAVAGGPRWDSLRASLVESLCAAATRAAKPG